MNDYKKKKNISTDPKLIENVQENAMQTPIIKDRRVKWRYEIVRRDTDTFYPVSYYTYFRFHKSAFNVGGVTSPTYKQKYLCLDCSETFFNMILRGEI